MCECDHDHDHPRPGRADGRTPAIGIGRRSVLRGAAATGGWLALGGAMPSWEALGGAAGAAEADPSTPPEHLAMGEDGGGLVSSAAADGAVTAAAIRPVRIPAPPIMTRAQWGADEALRTSGRGFSPIRKLIVHHTATRNDAVDWAGELRAVYDFHTEGRDYADIAYNFLIDPLGRLWEGRWARDYAGDEVHNGEDRNGNGVVGAHTLDYNTGTCGVALLGTYTDTMPSPAALEALTKVLAWKAGPRGLDPLGGDPFTRYDGRTETFPTIVGHRDLGATACPGEPLHTWLPELRRRVAARTRLGLVGYRVLTFDGTVASFGGAGDLGSARTTSTAAALAIAGGRQPQAYWVLTSDGGIQSFGDGGFYGSVPGLGIRTRSVDMAATPTGKGYWVLGTDGGIFCFGDASFHGSLGGVALNAPPVKLRSTPSGDGYWILGGDGGVFCFGDAAFYGSLGGLGVTTPTIDLAPTASGKGYWLLGGDGGVFCFGDAAFRGSVPGLGVRWSTPAVAMIVDPAGGGYHVLASDGGVFSFGEVPFFGSTAGSGRRPLGMAAAFQT